MSIATASYPAAAAGSVQLLSWNWRTSGLEMSSGTQQGSSYWYAGVFRSALYTTQSGWWACHQERLRDHWKGADPSGSGSVWHTLKSRVIGM